MKGKMEKPELQERAMKLMEALSGVDEELLERCEESGVRGKAPIPLWRYAKGWAAVLCLAIVGAAGWGGYRLIQETGKDMNSSGSACESMAQLEDMEVIMEDTLPSQEPEAGVPEAAPREEEGARSGDTASNGGNGGMGTGISETDRPSAESEDKEREENNNDIFDKQEEGVTEEVCPAADFRRLTEEEARGQELGGYVPTVLPGGYAFESAVTDPDSPEENLRLCWTRGMDSIMLSVTKVGNAPNTVDVKKPETYDERLYEIPYAESVPEEYRQSVNDPVFAREDFSLEMIRSRMKSYNDSGDTDTPRGNFSVLCLDGVLVKFNGRGTPEEIWEMFCSMEEF